MNNYLFSFFGIWQYEWKAMHNKPVQVVGYLLENSDLKVTLGISSGIYANMGWQRYLESICKSSITS